MSRAPDPRRAAFLLTVAMQRLRSDIQELGDAYAALDWPTPDTVPDWPAVEARVRRFAKAADWLAYAVREQMCQAALDLLAVAKERQGVLPALERALEPPPVQAPRDDH
jgi:hypothetical protein